MTSSKSITLSIFVGAAICGVIYLGLKNNDANYAEALAPLMESYSDANANANADITGGSRKRKGSRVKKSKRKGKKH